MEQVIVRLKIVDGEFQTKEFDATLTDGRYIIEPNEDYPRLLQIVDNTVGLVKNSSSIQPFLEEYLLWAWCLPEQVEAAKKSILDMIEENKPKLELQIKGMQQDVARMEKLLEKYKDA